MKTYYNSVILIACSCYFAQCKELEDDEITKKSTDDLPPASHLIKDILEHFKDPNSLNLPLPIPDPLIMPNRTYPFIGKLTTINVLAHGVSKIKIDKFVSDIVDMKLHFGVRLEKLEIIGTYFYESFFQVYTGKFNVTIVEAYTDCNAKLEVTRLGELEAADIKMDLNKHESLSLEMENAGFIGFIVSTLGELMFESIKPYIFKIINGNVRGNVNDHLKKLKLMFPNSIPPLDLAIAEMRKFARNNRYDPYLVPDYQYATSIYSVDVTHNVILGLSSFYRLGDVKILMDNLTVHIVVHMGTEVLEGNCNWEAGIAGILTKSGSASFTIDYINVLMSIDQSLDIRKKPKIADLSIKVGNIQLRMDGAGTLDYIAEFGINIIPNVLRYQIIQAAEMPIRRKIQEALDNTDIEMFIMSKLPLLDKHLYSSNSSSVIEDNFIDAKSIAESFQLDQDFTL